MEFKTVAQSFNEIDKTRSRTEITQLLAELLKAATPQEAQQLSYLSLGSLNPPYIGTQFNIAQKSMVKVIAQLLGQSEQWVKEKVEKIGDLGSVLEDHEWDGKGTVSVDDVYQALGEIEALSGTGSQEQKSLKLQELLHELDSVSAKYVIRIILGTLRLGFSDMTLIDALSWMEAGDKSLRKILETAYNFSADIGLLAFQLKKEGIAVHKKAVIRVGIPIRPAAAERLPDVQSIMDKLGPCVAQPKLDGFRLQVHIDKTGDKPLIRFFSRNLLDMSDMFPEFVKACEQLPVKTLIADGEAMVYDPNTGLFASFQETVKRRRKHGIDRMVSEFPLQLHIFDLLYLDGKSLLDESHTKRREELQKVLKTNQDETLQLIEEKQITFAQELEEYFIESIAGGLEGLVIKNPQAHYKPGKRNDNWIKLKYQASSKLLDTLDVVILGYYPGKGRRAQFGIGAFLVGIYNPRNSMFETVAKVGSGLTDFQWTELKEKCDTLKRAEPPKEVLCDKSLIPAVWINPQLVCEVLADEITLSPVHTAGKTEQSMGFALRFPRFVRFREDKNVYQATTVAELKKLHERY